ncbi:acylamino acid-releasing enzyme [Thraustotheca clavata]|uniref:mRNA (guanine-N(7))-methyltransferase n=1 Tax=Thraustotheca clavata TaxID=74557 RepID=A0A1V9Z7P2_9STRA|nr:acylamino acid-releasing enzyme [Thraustotheca clavata]
MDQLVPLRVLFGNAEFASPLVSPDGKQIAYLAPASNGVMNIFVKTIDSQDTTQLTQESQRPIRFFQWATNGTHLLYVQDLNGNERFHLYAVHVASQTTVDLTPFESAKVLTISRLTSFFYNKVNRLTSSKHPNVVIVGINDRDSKLFDMYQINIITGDRQLVAINPGNVEQWIADADLNIRAIVQRTDDGAGTKTLCFRHDDTDEYLELTRWDLNDEVAPLQLNEDGSGIYVLTSQGESTPNRTLRLVLLSSSDGTELQDIAHHPRADITDVVFNQNGEIDYAVYEYLMPEKVFVNASVQDDFTILADTASGNIEILSRTADDSAWTVGIAPDNGSQRFYHYNRSSKNLSFLGYEQPALEEYSFAHMTPVEIPCSDNETQVGYLTLPVGEKQSNLPLILVVHGGPWTRDHWSFDQRHQWLASRGYAVLSVNYRSSTGFGLRWVHLGNKQWGQAMQQDLTDAVNWAIKSGYANPTRVAIYGRSYGGYAALAGLAFTPNMYVCGVDVVGPSNIKTLLAATPPDWDAVKKMFALRIGPVASDINFNESISPLFHVDKMTKPLLIGQGLNDPRVPKSESDQIAKALYLKGQNVQYILYTDEGHGFHRPPNKIDFAQRTEEFLSSILGGKHAAKDEEATKTSSAILIDVSSLGPPPGWEILTSRSKGLEYYYHKNTRKQYWVDKDLPMGWSYIIEEGHRKRYFDITDKNGTLTYTKPAKPDTTQQRRGSNSLMDLLSPMPRNESPPQEPPAKSLKRAHEHDESSKKRAYEPDESSRKRPYKADDNSNKQAYEADESSRKRARVDNAMTDQQQTAEFYSSLQRASTGDRADSLLYHMRAMNNWIKSVLIREKCSTNCRVLDLACGKGGDMMKWAKQNVSMYMGVDIAQGSLEDAVGRIQKNRQLSQMDVQLVQGDLGKVSLLQDTLYCWNAKDQWHHAVPVLAPYSFDMVSMQFSFHYMFCDHQSAHLFFNTLRSMLPPGGTFIATTIDPDRMMQKLMASVGEYEEDGVTPAPIRIFDSKKREMCTIRMDPTTRARLLYNGAPNAEAYFEGQGNDNDDEGYGLRYKFTLRDGEDEQAVDLPEYLIPNSLLHELIVQNGFQLELQENFQSFVERYSQLPRHRELLHKMHVLNYNGTLSDVEWEIVSLYQVLAFRKLN